MDATGAKPINFTLSIDGMTCGHCVQAVTNALAAVPGVAVRTVAVGSAQITAPDGLTVARAMAALDDAGYPARASESRTGSAARAAAGAACCGSAATSVAPKGRGCCG